MAKTYLPLLDIENILPILDKISIFGGLSDKQLYTLFRLLQKVYYQPNEFIFEQGDQPSHIYIVKSGKVRLILDPDKSSFERAEFQVGQCFGETSVIGIMPHTATAMAVGQTELIVLSRQTLLSIFDTDKELFGMLILNIARETSRRLHQTEDIFLHYIRGD